MILPWFLNPWAEARRLEETNFALNRNWCDALAMLEECERENADLRRRIAEMEKWVPRDPRMADPGIIKMQREAQGVKFP